MIQLWKYIEIRDIIFCLSVEQSETFLISVDTVMGNFALKRRTELFIAVSPTSHNWKQLPPEKDGGSAKQSFCPKDPTSPFISALLWEGGECGRT